MKTNTFVQFLGKEILVSDLEKRVKELWKEKGGLVKDLNTLDVYVKVEESTCYYVINETESGSFPL